jgi:hypothetical protein
MGMNQLIPKCLKISKNSRLFLEWPREDVRSKMLLDASKSAHITKIKIDT